jgi:hypothetical protein
VVERFTLCLATACGTLLTTQNKDPNKVYEYEYIKNIIENSLNKAIPEHIYTWYRIHSDPKHKFTNETKEERRKDLKEFLLKKFPEEEVKIDELIVEQANSVGYDDDDFMQRPNENTVIDFKNLNNVYKNSPKTRRLRPRPRIKQKNKPEPEPSIITRLKKTLRPRTRKTNTNKNRNRNVHVNVPANVQPKPTMITRLTKPLRPRVRKPPNTLPMGTSLNGPPKPGIIGRLTKTLRPRVRNPPNTLPMGTSLNGPPKPSIISRLTKSTIKPRTRKGTSLNGPHI